MDRPERGSTARGGPLARRERGGFGSNHVERLLASHGYPVLQLAYFGEAGLPGELREIPLEYFRRALERLRADAAAERIVVLGYSRGGELALILGSRFPELVDGVAAYAPSSVVNSSLDCGPAWTQGGRPLAAATCAEFGNTGPANANAIIPVERIDGPLLTVAGIADAVWPAASYAAAIADRLEEHHRPAAMPGRHARRGTRRRRRDPVPSERARPRRPARVEEGGRARAHRELAQGAEAARASVRQRLTRPASGR